MHSFKIKAHLTTLGLFFPLTFAFLFLGCPVRSMNPMFGEKEARFNPALIGAWGDEKGTYTFEQSGEKGYVVTLREEKSGGEGEEGRVRMTKYNVTAGQIGKFWFLSSSPVEGGNDYHFVAGYLITRVSVDGDTLRMASLEGDWLKEMIDAKKFTVSHIRRGDEVILTASPAELRKLVARCAEDPKAFQGPSAHARMK